MKNTRIREIIYMAVFLLTTTIASTKAINEPEVAFNPENEYEGVDFGVEDTMRYGLIVGTLMKYTVPFAPMFNSPCEQKIIMAGVAFLILAGTLSVLGATLYLILSELSTAKYDT